MILEAYYGNIEILRLLLWNGQDPNAARGCYNCEPGMWALIGVNPYLETLHLMLQHIWYKEGRATHMEAAGLSNVDVLQ
ncbi:hypothetical protein BDV41DRAFT_214995 [Aspergillus transmontanensis]|uniref:Ankyrin repeat-containing domain protein n=1 Tax=Aspergillus transmontanensis TaxID=1034304 RepID=A0A5N6W3F9_9EURO|nr:hypothetical protein BDV41DRAFT_214995 [Aspergillus transmontanensis]